MINRRQQLFALLGDVTPPKKTLTFLALLMLAENLLTLVSPWLAGQFTSSLLNNPTTLVLSYKQILVVWVVLLACQGMLNFSTSFFSGKTTFGMLTKLRTKLYNHLQSLPLSYYHERRHGKILAVLTNDTAIISTFFTQTLISIIPLIITTVGAITCIFFIKPVIALMAALLFPLFFITTKLLGKSVRPLSTLQIKIFSNTLAIADENISTLPIIKSFTREDIESQRFSQENERLFATTVDYLRVQSMIGPVVKFLSTAIILGVLLLISDKVVSGELSTPDIVTLMLYGMVLTQPMSKLANIYAHVMKTLGATEQLLDVFSIEGEEMAAGEFLPPSHTSITFTDIHFAHPGRQAVLQGVNLCIQQGQTIAITGENGAGKSTLVHLLMRFLDPDQGTITIDNHNIYDLNKSHLRQQIGLVQQQVLLQNSTVMQNILFGRPDASMADIERAAQQAHALDFILKLPQGFDTVIGDKGVKLSGGQKQRLALARALVKDPQILILDEATAMFDPQGEQDFIMQCRQLLQDKTVILITHRPASLALADRVVRLENGVICEGEAIYPHRS